MEKRHKAWMILGACCLLEAGMIGILWNCTGLFYAPICEELGFPMGDFSLFVTLRSLAGALTVGILASLMHKVKLRPFLMVIIGVCCCAFIATCFYTKLYQWYISGILMGVAGSSFFMVSTALFINNWFYKKNGFAIGVAMAASGLGGAIFNPVISRLIFIFGWRKAAVMAGLIAFALAAPAAWNILLSPRQVGLEPYGFAEYHEEVKQGGGSQRKTILIRHLPRPAVTLAACMLLLGTSYFLSQYNGHLASFVQMEGYGIQIAGMVTSVAMLGNVGSKILMGWVADRRGVWFAVGSGLAISIVSFLLLLSSSLPVIFAGAFLYGTALTMSTVPPALVTKHVYGLKMYEKKYTGITTVNQVVAALAFSVIGYSRDIFGSYTQSFLLGIILCILSAISLLCLMAVLRGTETEVV